MVVAVLNEELSPFGKERYDTRNASIKCSASRLLEKGHANVKRGEGKPVGIENWSSKLCSH